MRVAYLINQYPSVSHSFIRREIQALEAQGVDVDRFALRGWDSKLVDPADLAELEQTRHTLRQGMMSVMGAMLNTVVTRPGPFWQALKLTLSLGRRSVRPLPYHLIYLAHACVILRWLKDRPVDHLHAHFGTNSTNIALLLQALGGPPYSFMIHGSEVFDDPTRHALPQKVDGAQFVATSCAYIGSQLMYHIPYNLWPKVTQVRCGLPQSAFSDSSLPLPKGPAFLSVGRLSPEKGHLILLEAFAQVHAAHLDATLIIAGDGPLRTQIESRIAELGLQEAVRITGWLTSAQVRAEIGAARVLVHPSFTEGLPVVIMEAMAGYRPVISTYIAGIPELVCPGETGWLVYAGQVDELVTAMEDSISLPDDAMSRLGASAHARAKSRHLVTTEACKLKSLFAGARP